MNGNLNRLTTVAVIAVSTAACGGGARLEGKYVGAEGDSLLESITLGSDGAASVVYPLGFGNSGQGSYTLDGDAITLTAPSGDRAQFQIDKAGCLTNVIVGKYCRDGSRGASSGGASAAGAAAGGGTERYEATTEQGRILLELMAGGTARMTMTPFGGGGSGVPQRMTFDLSYEVSGGNVSMEMPGEGPTELVRSGRDLLMTSGGETARFIRQ
jgi:hypothetical protein